MSAKKRLQQGLARLDEVPQEPPRPAARGRDAPPEVVIETGFAHQTSTSDDAWPMLEAACPTLQLLQQETELEQYVAPLLQAWQGRMPMVMQSLRRLTSSIEPNASGKARHEVPTGACEMYS